jgi:2-keto-4-pentenoate hydratase/2-oxohepta-3-ene-1,7-dioic acid hydratase in catechol pathway
MVNQTHMNDRDHIKELNNARPKQPFFFSKPTSSILLPRTGPFLRPRGARVNHEVELGLIIGKTVRDLHEEDLEGALDAIKGYYIHQPCSNIISFIDRLHSNYRHDCKKRPG